MAASRAAGGLRRSAASGLLTTRRVSNAGAGIQREPPSTSLLITLPRQLARRGGGAPPPPPTPPPPPPPPPLPWREPWETAHFGARRLSGGVGGGGANLAGARVPLSATSKAEVEWDADDHRKPTVHEGGGAEEDAGRETGEAGEGWERRQLEAASASTSGGGGGMGDTKREGDGEGGGGGGGERSAGTTSSTSGGGGGGGGDANWWDIAGFTKENPNVLSICATSGLLMAGHMCVAPVLPFFASEFGATATHLGMTLSAFAAAKLVFNLPCGILADHPLIGRRPLIVVGRDLHSSTFRLNVSTLRGIGHRGEFRGCLGGVQEASGGSQGVFGVCFLSEMAQVKLESG